VIGVVRVRILFKATMSRLRHYCSDVSSRRKRETCTDPNNEPLQHLNKELMMDALNARRDDIEQVRCSSIFKVVFGVFWLLQHPKLSIRTNCFYCSVSVGV